MGGELCSSSYATRLLDLCGSAWVSELGDSRPRKRPWRRGAERLLLKATMALVLGVTAWPAGASAQTPDIQRIKIEAAQDDGDPTYNAQVRVYAEGLTAIELRLPGEIVPVAWENVLDGFWEYEWDDIPMTLAEIQALQADGMDAAGDPDPLDYYRFTFAYPGGTDNVALTFTLPPEPANFLPVIDIDPDYVNPSFTYDPTGCTYDWIGVEVRKEVTPWSPWNEEYKEKRDDNPGDGPFVWQPGPLSPNTPCVVGGSTYTSMAPGSAMDEPMATSDGDAFEYGQWFGHAGSEIEFTTTPEPSGLSLLVIAAMVLIQRRRR